MFHINRDIFQTSPKLNRYLDNFCCKICKKPFKNSPIWSHWLRVLTTSSVEGFRWIFYWTEKKQFLRWPWKFVRMRSSSSFTDDAADATAVNEHFSLKYQKLIFSFRVSFCFCFFCFALTMTRQNLRHSLILSLHDIRVWSLSNQKWKSF